MMMEVNTMNYKDNFSEKIKKLLADGQWIVAEESYNPQENLTFETIFCG